MFQSVRVNPAITQADAPTYRPPPRMKVSDGADATDELIWIADPIADDDVTVKTKQIEQFTDSNSYVDIFQAAKGNK